MKLVQKCSFRIYRILRFRHRIYGKIGKKNRFTSGVIINELANIGNYNYFGNNSIITNAIIGNYCSIAPDAKIGLANHSIDYFTTYNKISRDLNEHSMFDKPAIIENDVWIGANVVIMQGVTIGNGAVIGANAVVTKDIPPYGIAVGSPAKVIRYRFDKESIEKISTTKWWNSNIKEAKAILKKL